jgi:hypothetical protein
VSVASIGSVLGLGILRHQNAGRGMMYFQPRAGVVFQPGSAVVHRIGSDLVEVPLSATPRTDLVSLGFFVGCNTFTASSTADANGGAVDATSLQKQCITIEPFDRTGYFSTGTGSNLIAVTDVDKPCFWYDDNTLYLGNGNDTLSFAGFVDDVRSSDGAVTLRSNAEIRALYELYSAGAAASGYTSDDSVRAVATSLPAGTFAAGVLTLTATGAFSTAQDGVTLAVGDKFILPVGTITTLVVSAANSGVYEVTSLGATGTSATFTRSAKWAHGAIITPCTKVRVGGAGTLFPGTTWTAQPLTAVLVVGTGDPSLYPDKVIQTVALTSSAATIINVPIRSATKSNVHAALAAVGGTTTSTIGYGIIVAPTAGGIGTASTVVNAIASGGTKNGTSDTSSLIVTILN